MISIGTSLTLTVIWLSLAGCDSEPLGVALTPDEPPLADFSYQFKQACNTPVIQVLFYNTSTNSDSFEWNFGDGTTSKDVSPIKIYQNPGSYNVSLKAMRDGKVNQLAKELHMERTIGGLGPQIGLSSERVNAGDLTLMFFVTTNGAEYLLQYGDGETLKGIGSQDTILHTYAGHGRYQATVMSENEDGVSCASVVIDLQP